MGMLYFVNQTPVEWFSKRQNTVETATYGSEFVAAKTCVEHIMVHIEDVWHSFRWTGLDVGR